MTHRALHRQDKLIEVPGPIIAEHRLERGWREVDDIALREPGDLLEPVTDDDLLDRVAVLEARDQKLARLEARASSLAVASGEPPWRSRTSKQI